MKLYIVKRLARFVPAFFGVTILVFMLLHLAPGDAARIYLTERGIDLSAESLKKARRELGLDKPLYQQYAAWLCGIARLDLGVSSANKQPVRAELAARLRVTLLLALSVLPPVIIVAFPLGLLSAMRQNSLCDGSIRCVSIFLLSLPPFCLAFLLILLLSVTLHLLPSFGAQSAAHFIMPCITLSLASTAYYTRLIRSAFLEEFSEEYIRAARSRGVTPFNLVRSAMKNANIPIITSLGMSLAHLLGGQVIIEKIFALPGMGSYLIDGIMRRDYNAVQGCVLVYVVLFSLLNLIVDLMCAALNPKERLRMRVR